MYSWICASPVEQRGAHSHFIHSVPTIFSLFWSPLGRNSEIRQQPGMIIEFKSISSWFNIREMAFPEALADSSRGLNWREPFQSHICTPSLPNLSFPRGHPVFCSSVLTVQETGAQFIHNWHLIHFSVNVKINSVYRTHKGPPIGHCPC